MEKIIQITGHKIIIIYTGTLLCMVGAVGAIFRNHFYLNPLWFLAIFLCGFMMVWFTIVAQEKSDIIKLQNLVVQQNMVVAYYSGITTGEIATRPFTFYVKCSDQILLGKLREKHSRPAGNPLPLYHYDVYQGKKRYYILTIHSDDQYAEITAGNNNRVGEIRIFNKVLDVSLAGEKFQLHFQTQDEIIETITKNTNKIATGRPLMDNTFEFHFGTKITKEQMLLLSIFSLFSIFSLSLPLKTTLTKSTPFLTAQTRLS